jgi:hypothetical protein
MQKTYQKYASANCKHTFERLSGHLLEICGRLLGDFWETRWTCFGHFGTLVGYLLETFRTLVGLFSDTFWYVWDMFFDMCLTLFICWTLFFHFSDTCWMFFAHSDRICLTHVEYVGLFAWSPCFHGFRHSSTTSTITSTSNRNIITPARSTTAWTSASTSARFCLWPWRRVRCSSRRVSSVHRH